MSLSLVQPDLMVQATRRVQGVVFDQLSLRGHQQLLAQCLGKAFDFVSRNIGEVRIILALEIVCRQAGQMLYPYFACL